jgi:hypothetical protein
MSSHLANLKRSELVTHRRNNRSIIYRAEVDRLRQLVIYLIEDCCNGRPETCAPLLAGLVPLAAASRSRHD